VATYADLIAQVHEDLLLENHTAQISTAISTAIEVYEQERFWFNEIRATTTTSSGQEFYDLPSDFIDIDTLTCAINNNTYPLIQRDFKTIDDWFITASTYSGYPDSFCIYDEQLRLYPVPDGAYTMTIAYQYKPAALSAGTDSNSWTNDARNLIRFSADADVALNYRQDPKRYALFKQQEARELSRLRSRTAKSVMTGKTRPW